MSEEDRAQKRDVTDVAQEEPLPPDLEDEVRVVLDDYIAALDSGKKPDREAILAAHPRVAEELDRRLEAVERLQEAALVAQTTENQAGAKLGLRCPHCGHALALDRPG